jgi:hypothetical protein
MCFGVHILQTIILLQITYIIGAMRNFILTILTINYAVNISHFVIRHSPEDVMS